MDTTDNVSCELRRIEKEIDNYYKSNPLLKLPFATAAWSLLTYAEDYISRAMTDGIQEPQLLASEFACELGHSLWWLFNTCKSEGKIPSAFDGNLHNTSKDLFELGKKYESFVFAYTCFSRDWIELNVKGSIIQPTEDFFTGMEYEVYNILIDWREPKEALSSMNIDSFLTDVIYNSLRIEGNRFRYELNTRIVTDAITYLRPIFDRMFLLPNKWEFSRYTLTDFQKVFEVICAIAHIHRRARLMAVPLGTNNRGCADNIYIMTYGELIRRVAKCSDMSPVKVQSILDDLTYGNSGVRHPDPALQPLIKLNSKHYAIVPHLWICSAAERNLTALLNKLPSEKRIYAKLVDEKEVLMKKNITTDLPNTDFKLVSGNVSNLGDVDLAIINHAEKACLLLELKWFIAPTTARERIEKSEEIEKGISQVIKLKRAFTDNYSPLLDKLQIDSSYHFEGVVVSQNWIGYANVQSPKVPVIRADHLIEKLKVTENLQSTMEWLKDREYLPKEGKHFKMVDGDPLTIGNWSLKSPEIELLVRDTFFPL